MGVKLTKGWLIGGAALAALLTSPALAADMPFKTPAPPAPTAYNWTGFFTGSSLGWQSWDISGIYVTPPPDRQHTEGSRGVFGSHVGAQYQVNSWVLGVEAAFNTPFSHTSTSSTGPSGDCNASLPAVQSCSSRINNTWTAGARLGYAFDRFMAYGTGGFASGRVDTATQAGNLLTSSTGVRQDGWFAGAGAEYFVTKFLWSDLILGAEYQHIDLGTARHTDTLTGAPIQSRDVKATEDIARARMIFKWTP
jgi:outer membrane immunogenic protein